MKLYESIERRIRAIYPPDRLVCSYLGQWLHREKYIQISTPLGGGDNFDAVHYELLGGDVDHNVVLHFEFDRRRDRRRDLIDFLRKQTPDNDEYNWEFFDGSWGEGFQCIYSQVATDDNFERVLKEFTDYFDPLIKDYCSLVASQDDGADCGYAIEGQRTLTGQKDPVDLHTLTLGELFKPGCHNLFIPDYQRIYCWEERSVTCLLEDLTAFAEGNNYHLGTIILHYRDRDNDNRYDIIDGQQRLVTLALLLRELGFESDLLNREFYSERSCEYIAYNRYLIQEFCEKNRRQCGWKWKSKMLKKLLNSVELSILVLTDTSLLKNTSLDLAYTFFSTHNSRGLKLSDYDLLKAHHLRFFTMSNEDNCETDKRDAEAIASAWNGMIERSHAEKLAGTDVDYERMLDTYVYRLRRWWQKEECDDRQDNYRIKKEYEATIPTPTDWKKSERFHYNELICGGTHFFDFVRYHLEKYEAFVATDEYRLLRRYMVGEGSVDVYRDAIESVCFAYFLKFGETCLAEALAVIMRIILQHRYETSHARKDSILRYVSSTNLCQLIDRSTVPTLFLEATRERCQKLPETLVTGIRWRMQRMARDISSHSQIKLEPFRELNQ